MSIWDELISKTMGTLTGNKSNTNGTSGTNYLDWQKDAGINANLNFGDIGGIAANSGMTDSWFLKDSGAGNAFGNSIANNSNPGMFSGLMDSAFGKTDPTTGMVSGGFAMPAIGAFQAYTGYTQGKEQLKLAKDSLASSKNQFAQEFGAQQNQINEELWRRSGSLTNGGGITDMTQQEYYDKFKV